MNLNFLYCFDNNFNQQAMTSICSLLDKTTIKINLYIIHNDIEELKNWLQPVEQHPMILSINIYDFNDLDTELPPIKTHISEATYYRMFVSNFITDNIKYLVYLDADIICLNDPASMIKNTISTMKKEDTSIAALPEKYRAKENKWIQRLNLKNYYFNAGVLIIDLERWVEEEAQKNLLSILKQRYDVIKDYDQEVMNIFFNEKYTSLNVYSNYQATSADPELLVKIKEQVIFLHYLGKSKPWSVEGAAKPLSVFYQNEYRKLGRGKYHITFKRDKYILKKYLKIIISLDFLKLEYPGNYLVKSLTSLIWPKR